jgi:hypothetical protein
MWTRCKPLVDDDDDEKLEALGAVARVMHNFPTVMVNVTGWGAVQVKSSWDPQLESAWSHPLSLWSEKNGFKPLLSNGSTCTATTGTPGFGDPTDFSTVGGCTTWIQLTHSAWNRLVSTLEPVKWKNWFQSLLSHQNFNLYRYTTNLPLARAVGLCTLNSSDP